ncbi:lysozyme [Pseudomonas proteolytica]|uniref:lysozyme n=1 Tax=Pseudomonas proteolytica TaxID=219574 RepID=UPI001474F158|nr:lysozyme [Pseudomonas proteolytica]NMZ04768.1 lysozyme [Pseudomonas proteolytica]
MSLRGKIAAGAMVLSSSTLVVFLGTWEGNGQNTVYADKLARGLPTVCKGITRHTSPYPVVVGDYWSDARCDEVEQLVIRKGQLQLADCITNQDVGQNTFDALSSHGHNFGTLSTCASRAVGLINAGRIEDGCEALAWAPDGKTPVWAFITTAQGKKVFIPGLHARRLDEVKLCKAGL